MYNSDNLYKRLKTLYYALFGQPRAYKKDLLYFKKCSSVLDIGCGHGHFAGNDIGKIIGIDINTDSVKLCHKKSITALASDVLKIPFRANSFDGVHCAHVIEHFEYPKVKDLLQEIDRVLSPNGILLIKTPMPNKFFFNDVTHVRPYPPSALFALMGLSTDNQYAFDTHDKHKFKFSDLYFSRRQLFQPDIEVGIAPGKYFGRTVFKAFGMLIGKLGIRHWEKSEYTMVFQKL